MHRPLVITGQPPLPGNSQHTIWFDTTKGTITATAAAASAQAPGTLRHRYAGRRWTGTVLPAAQAITVVFEIMTTSSGTTSSAFETDTSGPGGGSISVAAGTTQPFSWLPHTPDARIRIVAGATAPDSITTTLELVRDRTSGV